MALELGKRADKGGGRRENGRKKGIQHLLTSTSTERISTSTSDPPSPKTQKLKTQKQALVRKLLDLKSQLDDARSLAAAAEDARRAAERERDEAREERDNAKSSLAAHVAELVERGEECGRLRGAVEELTKALGGDEDGRGAGGGEASGSDDGGDEHGLPSAPEGDTKARARDAKMIRDLASLEAEKLAAEMISAAEEESRGGGGDYFSR